MKAMCNSFDVMLVEWSCETWDCLCDVSDAVSDATAHKYVLTVQFSAQGELSSISYLDAFTDTGDGAGAEAG